MNDNRSNYNWHNRFLFRSKANPGGLREREKERAGLFPVLVFPSFLSVLKQS